MIFFKKVMLSILVAVLLISAFAYMEQADLYGQIQDMYRQLQQKKPKPAEQAKEQNTASVNENKQKPAESQSKADNAKKDAPPVSPAPSMKVQDVREAYYLTYDQLKAMEHMSIGDRMRMLWIGAQLAGEDMKQLIALANGGITLEEKKEMEQLLEKKLGDADIKELYRVAEGYRKEASR